MQEAPRPTDPDEYLKRLREELIQPRTYRVKGVYAFQGKDNPFTGLFDIDRDGKIAGTINDPSSLAERHIVHGEVQNIDTLTALRFVKIAPGLLADIYYLLLKPNDGAWAGDYTGEWQLQEPTLDLDLTPNNETSNQTTITLSA